VVQRYFKNTDTLKDQYYHNLAGKVMRNVHYHSNGKAMGEKEEA
jgi:hypothetical protein